MSHSLLSTFKRVAFPSVCVTNPGPVSGESTPGNLCVIEARRVAMKTQ